MNLAPLRWVWRNLSSLVLAFILAVAVWVSAVVAADPNEKHTFRLTAIEQIGRDPGLVLVNTIPAQARLTFTAPKSIWNQLNNNPILVRIWIDLTGLGPGEHQVPVKANVDLEPIRMEQIDPALFKVVLEPLVRKDFNVETVINGDLPLGYKKGPATVEPGQVSISGPASQVEKISRVRATINVSGATQAVRRLQNVEVLDKEGKAVSDLAVIPKEVTLVQPVSLMGGFKNVAVKVVTAGQVANGYRLTNTTVTPPTVTLFSDNLELIQQMPGYVETLPVKLDALTADVEISVNLNLPAGATLVSESGVLVQVNVAAIERSLTLSVPVRVIGLAEDLRATISPETVDIIVTGPLSVLDKLTPDNFGVILDLANLPPGVYQRSPLIAQVPENVRVQTTLPEIVEVSIEAAPTPTPTLPGLATPSPLAAYP